MISNDFLGGSNGGIALRISCSSLLTFLLSLAKRVFFGLADA